MKPTTWKEVLSILGREDKEYHPAVKIEMIVEAYEGSNRKINWRDGSKKYFVWWDMEDNSFHASHYFSSGSLGSARMCFLKEENLFHAIKHFEQEYREYFGA